MNDLDMIIREAVTHTRGFDVQIARYSDGRYCDATVYGHDWSAAFDYQPSWDGCWVLSTVTVDGKVRRVNGQPDRAALLAAIEGAA